MSEFQSPVFGIFIPVFRLIPGIDENPRNQNFLSPVNPGNFLHMGSGVFFLGWHIPTWFMSHKATFVLNDLFNISLISLCWFYKFSAYEDCGACSGATAISSLDRIWCDYIFYSGPVKPVRAQSVPISTVPLPNANFGSDHYSITADFQIL